MQLLARKKKHRRPTPGAAPGTLVVPTSAPKPVIHLMDYTPAKLEERTIASPSEIAPYLSMDDPSVTWVDVQGLGDRVILDQLKGVFDIHQLALADAVNVPQRPKVELFDRYLFVITRMVIPTPSGELRSEQVSLFLGRNFVLSFQETYGDCLDPLRARIRGGGGVARKSGADYLAYAVIDAIVDQYFPIVETLGERIEDLEDEVASDPSPRTLRKIYEFKRTLLEIRRAVWPQREAVNALLHDESGLISKEVRFYLRDCYDHAIQVLEVVESLRELTTGLLDVYLSSMANKTNEVMKILTVVAAIFIPLTFIAGVYGMNFQYMPELAWRWGYFTVLGLMAACAVGMLVYFRRKHWL